MRQTLDSVVAQSVLPAKWIVVDDGSTDATPAILAEYADRHDWIQIVTRKDRGRRSVGPGVVEAFYDGYSHIEGEDYEFLCKLDLDLRLPEKYFEILLDRMKADPRLGTCSGKPYLKLDDGSLVSERIGDEMSAGMTKFYRATCFREIGGFVREVMWDGIDCHKARMLGWIATSWDEPDLRFTHLRIMGSSQDNILVGRMRNGFGQYFMGTGFIYLAATAVFRMTRRPYVIGGLAILWGYVRSALKGDARFDDPEFRVFLRSYQCRTLFFGKKRAIQQLQKKHSQ